MVTYETLSQPEVRWYLPGGERHSESKESYPRTPHSHDYSSQGLNQDCKQAHFESHHEPQRAKRSGGVEFVEETPRK